MQLHTRNSWPTVSILNVFGRHPNWIKKKTTQKEETKQAPTLYMKVEYKQTVAYTKCSFKILSVTSTFINTDPLALPEKGSCLVTSKTFIRSLFGASYHQILTSLPLFPKPGSHVRVCWMTIYSPVKSLVFLEWWLPVRTMLPSYIVKQS